jgi:hypothetical protein
VRRIRRKEFHNLCFVPNTVRHGDQVKGDEADDGRTCSKHGSNEKLVQNFIPKM